MSGVAMWIAVALLGGVGAVVRVTVTARLTPKAHERPGGGRSWAFGASGASRADGRPGGGRPSAPGVTWRATLLVNLVGALAFGALVGADASRELTLVLGGGLLGALTTFSTWIAEAVDRRSPGLLAGALALGLAAAATGHAVGTALC